MDHELQLAACADIAALSALLARTSLDPAQVVAGVPECVDGAELARALFAHAPLGEAAAAACVRRAEAVDAHTGRLDWAIRWLQALPAHPQVARALRNARILDRLIGAAGMQPWTLAAANAMGGARVVARVLELAAADPELAPVLAELRGADGLRAAWNAWWLHNMVGCDLAPAAIELHAAWFNDRVLLATVYAVGAPCVDAARAEAALLAVAGNHGLHSVDRAAHIRMPERLRALISAADWAQPDQWLLSADEASQAVAAGLAQAQALRTLSQHAQLDLDMPAIAQCQDCVPAQQRLLARCLQSPGPETLAWLLELRELQVFGATAADRIRSELLRALLLAGQLDAARALLAASADSAFADPVADTACAAARELLDNADSASRDSAPVRAALQCLDAVPAAAQSAAAQHERLLADAAHLVWTLGAPPGALRIFRAADTRLLPIEIRHIDDPFELLRLVLERYPEAFRRQRVVREIAAALLQLKLGVSVEMSLRDLAVRSPEELFAVALMLEAAVRLPDAEAARGFVLQLSAARAVAAPLMAAAELQRAACMLGHGPRDVGERALDTVWTACRDLALQCPEGAELRRDAAALALSLCPTSEMPALLQLHEARAAVVTPATDVLSRVRETLVGAAAAEAGEEAARPVDPGSVRTFDPAIIRRCLRTAADRELLLLEWLDFALTTATEPRDARAQRFRDALEAEIASAHADRAAGHLQDRVRAQLDPTNLTQMQQYYTMLARCLSGDDAERMLARAALAQALVLHAELRDLDLDAVVRALDIESRDGSVEQLCQLDVPPEALAPVAPELARVCAAEGHGLIAAAALASGLRLRQLQRLVDHAQATGDAAPVAGELAAHAAQLEAADAAQLSELIAYDATRIDASARAAILQPLAPCTDAQAIRAREYAELIAAIAALRDPFAFARVPNEWVRALDVGARGGPAEARDAWLDVLSRMAAEVPAYLVCQTCVLAAAQLARWQTSGLGLAAVYTRALDQALADHGDVERICDGPLELCAFDHGASDLGAALSEFREQFGRELARVVSDDGVDSAMRLRVLQVEQRYFGSGLDNGAAELRLLADRHWTRAVGAADTAEQRHTEWQQLLEHTQTDAQVAALVRLLELWTEDRGLDACWARLLAYAVEHAQLALVLPAALCLGDSQKQALGNVVEQMLAQARQQPELVASACTLALVWTDGAWAEPAMQLVATHAQLPKAVTATTVSADEDAWGIDDAFDDDDTDDLPAADVLNSPLLHLAICARAHLAGSPPALLDALSLTLLDPAVARDYRDVLSVLAPHARRPLDDLRRRYVHALYRVGLHERALQLVYAVLDVPVRSRVRGKGVAMWVRQLDFAVGGAAERPCVADSQEQPKGIVEEEHAWGDDVDIDLDLDLDPVAVQSEPEPDAWGDDDDDIDLDADLRNL